MPTNDVTVGIKEFLEMQVNLLNTGNFPKIGHYFGYADFILQHGFPFDATDLPKQYERGAPKECFSNAFQMAGDHSNLVYCEGYACGVIPVHHAWCVDQQTRSAVEVTWERKNTFGYLGIPINFHYVIQAIARKGTHGVIDDWKNEWPMLKDDRSQWLHPSFR